MKGRFSHLHVQKESFAVNFVGISGWESTTDPMEHYRTYPNVIPRIDAVSVWDIWLYKQILNKVKGAQLKYEKLSGGHFGKEFQASYRIAQLLYDM